MECLTAAFGAPRAIKTEINPLETPIDPFSVITALAQAAIHQKPCCINLNNHVASCEAIGALTGVSRTVYEGSRAQLLGLSYHIALCVEILKPSEGHPISEGSSLESSSKKPTLLAHKIYALFELAQRGLVNYIIPRYKDDFAIHLALQNTHSILIADGLEYGLNRKIATLEPSREVTKKIRGSLTKIAHDLAFLESIYASFQQAQEMANKKNPAYADLLSAITGLIETKVTNSSSTVSCLLWPVETDPAPSGGAGSGAGEVTAGCTPK